MTETTMPATEAIVDNFDERNSYEFAFHVLPTVAEGEVSSVFDEIKARITQVGEIFDEEAPERTDLVYAIVKSMENKNRKFTSAYFGWVRVKLNADAVDTLLEDLHAMPTLLRSIIVKLTVYEEAHPFRFHENRKSQKMVEVIKEGEILEEVQTEIEEDVEVSEKALDESLDKITHDEEVK